MQTLDAIQKRLEDYLNAKRAVFARFFFLSNDDLLEILKEGKNPLVAQQYMPKLFDSLRGEERWWAYGAGVHGLAVTGCGGSCTT